LLPVFRGLSRNTGCTASRFSAARQYFSQRSQPSKVEIVNDTNGELVNFFEVLKRDFSALEKEIAVRLHGRKQHRQARVIYENPEMFDRVKRARAVWTLANSENPAAPEYPCL
jgi:DNA adenine methylase